MSVQEYGRERDSSGDGPFIAGVALVLLGVFLFIGWNLKQGAAARAFEAACLDAGGRVGTVGSVYGCFPESIRTLVLEVEAP